MASIVHDAPPPAPAPLGGPRIVETDNIYVGLSDEPLNILTTIARVKSPKAGAVVMFAGTTRDNFQGVQVTHLSYTAYPQLALKTLQSIAEAALEKHGLVKIAILHRLGEVPIGEESILVVVSSAHRTAAWRAGEEVLEECKARLEVWKREEFVDGGVWRANKDCQGTEGGNGKGPK